MLMKRLHLGTQITFEEPCTYQRLHGVLGRAAKLTIGNVVHFLVDRFKDLAIAKHVSWLFSEPVFSLYYSLLPFRRIV